MLKLGRYQPQKTQLSHLKCQFHTTHVGAVGWEPHSSSTTTCTGKADHGFGVCVLFLSLICITCSLENNAFSVLHYVMVASHYSMLHRLEIFSTPGTIAQIVLTKYIQCWAAVLCNNHSIIGALRKDHAKFHAKNNVYCYTAIHFNIEENACLQWNATRQCLD